MAGFSPQQIEKVVEVFLNKLAAKDALFKTVIEANKKALMDTMTALIMKQKPDLSPKDLLDKNFIKQLTIAFVTTLTLTKISFDQNKNFFDRIKNIFNGRDDLLKKIMDPKLDPKELEKLLTEEDKRKLQEEIKKCCAEILHDLNRLGLIKPKTPQPGMPKPKLDEEMSKHFEAYSNLLGLLTSAVTGSMPVVVQCMLGNGLGFVAYNPNRDSSQLGLQNRTDDYYDVEGNIRTMSNYLQFEGDELVDEFIKDLQTTADINHTPPRPKGPGSLPGVTAY